MKRTKTMFLSISDFADIFSKDILLGFRTWYSHRHVHIYRYMTLFTSDIYAVYPLEIMGQSWLIATHSFSWAGSNPGPSAQQPGALHLRQSGANVNILFLLLCLGLSFINRISSILKYASALFAEKWISILVAWRFNPHLKAR